MTYLVQCSKCGMDYQIAFIHECKELNAIACLDCGVLDSNEAKEIPVEFVNAHKGHNLAFWPSRINFDPEYFLAAISR